MNMLKSLGRWRSGRFDVVYPHPREVMQLWDKEEKDNITRYLLSGCMIDAWLSARPIVLDPPSQQRIAPWIDLTDGVWKWRKELIVYVYEYNVGLPESFREHAREKQYKIDREIDIESLRFGPVSTEDWLEWSNRVRSNRLYALLSRIIRR